MSETANTETILIVDDNPDNLRVLGGILRERGHHIRIAANGKQALESAQAFPPNLIMLDIRMPEMDGYEACRRLKASDRLKNIPVLTGMKPADD
jgi:CheY-like chemotaxis protein